MFRRCWSSIVTLVLATTGVVIFTAPAHASTTGWPQDVTDVQDNHIMSTVNGGVFAGNCSDRPTAVKVFAADGSITSSVPQRTDGIYNKSCHAQSAVDKDGTVFGIAEDHYTKFAVVAYKNNAVLWQKPLLHYCSNIRQMTERAINRVLVGPDGFVYAVTVPHQCFSGYYLTKHNVATGAVVFEKQLSRNAVSFLEATSRGIIYQDTASVIRYLRYDNTEFAPAVTAQGWVSSIDLNGRAFATENTINGGCASSTMRMYTPGSATPFTFAVPACWQVQQVQATSENGLSTLVLDQEGKPRLQSYTPNGSGFTVATLPLPLTDGYRSFKDFTPWSTYITGTINADINGNILLIRPYLWQRNGVTLTGWRFTLYGANLLVLSEYDTDTFTFQQEGHYARGMRWAMAKDRLYVTIGYCTNSDPYQCGSYDAKLYALRLVRLGMDYPRGAILGVAPTTVDCKPVHFVGLRGSGEDPFANEGLGEPVKDIKDRLVAAGLTNMEVTAVAYPATPADYFSGTYPPDYRDSVAAGIDALSGVLLQINRDCPQSQIVVAAYSQGAHATDGIRFLPLVIQNQIKAMVLAGDPLFNPALIEVNKGTFENLPGIWVYPGPGALPLRQFATSMTGKVASYCLAGDMICNFSPANMADCARNIAMCPHVLYKPDWTQQSATWIRSKVTS